MLDHRYCLVRSTAELDAEIRDIFALDMVGRSHEIGGTLHVNYTDESVKQASLISFFLGIIIKLIWRPRAESNRRFRVLQTLALTVLATRSNLVQQTGFEPVNLSF